MSTPSSTLLQRFPSASPAATNCKSAALLNHPRRNSRGAYGTTVFATLDPQRQPFVVGP